MSGVWLRKGIGLDSNTPNGAMMRIWRGKGLLDDGKLREANAKGQRAKAAAAVTGGAAPGAAVTRALPGRQRSLLQ